MSVEKCHSNREARPIVNRDGLASTPYPAAAQIPVTTMLTTTYARRAEGATVYKRARLVMHITECHRKYGVRHKTAEVEGKVVAVRSRKTEKRSVKNIEADGSVLDIGKRVSISLASVRASSVSTNSNEGPEAAGTEITEQNEGMCPNVTLTPILSHQYHV